MATWWSCVGQSLVIGLMPVLGQNIGICYKLLEVGHMWVNNWLNVGHVVHNMPLHNSSIFQYVDSKTFTIGKKSTHT